MSSRRRSRLECTMQRSNTLVHAHYAACALRVPAKHTSASSDGGVVMPVWTVRRPRPLSCLTAVWRPLHLPGLSLHRRNVSLTLLLAVVAALEAVLPGGGGGASAGGGHPPPATLHSPQCKLRRPVLCVWMLLKAAASPPSRSLRRPSAAPCRGGAAGSLAGSSDGDWTVPEL